MKTPRARYRYPIYFDCTGSGANDPPRLFTVFAGQWSEGAITTAELVNIYRYYGILWMWNDELPY